MEEWRHEKRTRRRPRGVDASIPGSSGFEADRTASTSMHDGMQCAGWTAGGGRYSVYLMYVLSIRSPALDVEAFRADDVFARG